MIGTVADMIGRYGQSLILRRLTVTGTPEQVKFDVALPGVVRAYKLEELIAGIIQGDREVTISDQEIAAAQWPGPPRRSDRVMIAGVETHVEAVNTVYVGDDVAKHVLQVRG